MKFSDITLILSATLTALMAGFFFSYSISVSLGLGKLTDKEYLQSMQSINKEVQNPIFFMCFFGALIMLSIVTYQQYSPATKTFIIPLTALFFYLIGVIGVTVFVNVPLNNRLELFDLCNATEPAVKQMRNIFEKRWNFWNNIRTVIALCAVVFIVGSCIMDKSK